MKVFSALVALLCILAVLAIHTTEASVGFANCSRVFINGFIPGKPSGDTEICRDGVIGISYRGEYRNPTWSSYYVTPEDVKNNIHGRDSFYWDPDLRALDVKQAGPDAEVWSSTWNRGHLAPSRIMSWSEDSKYATYTCANIAPQYYKFNQQTWEHLESDLFEWVGDNKALYIVTGTAVEGDRPRYGPDDEVVIPTYYWKAICDPSTNQSAAFYGYNTEDPVKAQRKERMKTTQDVTYISRSSPSLGVTMENFITVDELAEKITKNGKIFPWSHCQTDKVDQSYWGFTGESWGSYNIKDIREKHPRSNEVLRELYEADRLLYKQKKQGKKH